LDVVLVKQSALCFTSDETAGDAGGGGREEESNASMAEEGMASMFAGER
jgi:hypothetical protein